jgi:hypothetical protein
VRPVVANVTGPPTVIPPVDPVLPNTSVEAVMLSRSVWLSANPPVAPSVIAVDGVNGTNVTVWPDALTAPLTLMLSVSLPKTRFERIDGVARQGSDILFDLVGSKIMTVYVAEIKGRGIACVYQKSDSAILVMKSAEDRL